MDCRQAQQLFDAYLDGDLSPSLVTELGAHRVHCADCRRALALLEVSGHILCADHDVVVADEAFTDRLLACMDEPRSILGNRLWRYGSIGSGIAAAALVALALLGMFDTRKRGVVAGERAEGAVRPLVPTMASSPLPVASFEELLDDGAAGPGIPGGALQDLANQSPAATYQRGGTTDLIGRVIEYTAEQGRGALKRATENSAPPGKADDAAANSSETPKADDALADPDDGEDVDP